MRRTGLRPVPALEREELTALTSMKDNGVWMVAEGGIRAAV
jgi:hypothetical protein